MARRSDAWNAVAVQVVIARMLTPRQQGGLAEDSPPALSTDTLPESNWIIGTSSSKYRLVAGEPRPKGGLRPNDNPGVRKKKKPDHRLVRSPFARSSAYADGRRVQVDGTTFDRCTGRGTAS